jgi:hypothetical protein
MTNINTEKRHQYEIQDLDPIQRANKVDALGDKKKEFHVNLKTRTATADKLTVFFYETSNGFSLNSYDWKGRELLTEEDFRLIDDACWCIATELRLIQSEQSPN